MKALIDINILMDVLAEREPFHAAAAAVWTLVESGRAAGCVASVSCTTIYYLARRLHGSDRAAAAVRKVTEVFEIAPVDGGIVERALDSGMRDFEDAVQAFAGGGCGATHVISRDATGFVGGPLPVLTPEQFLAAVGASGQ